MMSPISGLIRGRTGPVINSEMWDNYCSFVAILAYCLHLLVGNGRLEYNNPYLFYKIIFAAMRQNAQNSLQLTWATLQVQRSHR